MRTHKRFAALMALVVMLITLTFSATRAEEGYRVADVVVVGGGGAGLSAAIEAADAGEDVIVLEKQPVLGGTLLYTAGTMSGAETKVQKAQGIEDSVESHFMDTMKEGEYRAIPELLKLYVDNAGPTIDWLVDDLGVDIKEAVFAPEHTLYSRPRTYKPAMIDGEAAPLVALKKAVAARPSIEVHTSTRVVKLVQNQYTGRVTGVLAVDPEGRLVNIGARKGVVLATGGYSLNPDILRSYLPGAESWLMIAAPGATGDGIIMAQEVGGALTHMDCVPTFNMGFVCKNGRTRLVYTRAEVYGGIYVNKHSKRFVNEIAANSLREAKLREQPDALMFEIFDETVRKANNKANVDALIDAGEIPQAQTIAELAHKVGLDPEALEAEVARYNGFVDKGQDDDFGRAEMPTKIDTPPFYAVKLRPLGLLTLGGLRVDTQLRVVDTAGQPIPGLYAAGEVVGGVHGSVVSSGNGVTVSLTFGRLAGQNVAKLDAVSTPFDATAEAKADSGAYKDGVYIGTGDGFKGPVKVEVTVKDGKIASIDVLENVDTHGMFMIAEDKVPARIIEAGTPDVDVVSGATYSSRGIMEAVENALVEAK